MPVQFVKRLKRALDLNANVLRCRTRHLRREHRGHPARPAEVIEREVPGNAVHPCQRFTIGKGRHAAGCHPNEDLLRQVTRGLRPTDQTGDEAKDSRLMCPKQGLDIRGVHIVVHTFNARRPESSQSFFDRRHQASARASAPAANPAAVFRPAMRAAALTSGLPAPSVRSVERHSKGTLDLHGVRGSADGKDSIAPAHQRHNHPGEVLVARTVRVHLPQETREPELI